MAFRSTLLIILATVLFLPASQATAHSLFMKALKAKYGFNSVSCYTCHAKKDALPANAPPKSVRNGCGKLFEPHIAGLNIGVQVDQAKLLKKQDKDAQAEAIEAAITNYFLKAWKVVGAMEDDSGMTYEMLLNARAIEGIR